MLRTGSWRREDGQTGAEYLGALMIVGAIVARRADRRRAGRDRARRAPGDLHDPGRHRLRRADRGRRLRRRRLSRLGRGDREIYDANCGATPDDPEREGDDGAVGNEQVDEAYANLGRVYDYYHDKFGYDSYDGKGAPVVGIVNVCDGGTSSYWCDGRVHFAPGAGDALDTAAHEFTHGVTENTAGLRYECQSGALNESISDIMAWNLDPEDPTYGEDRNGDGPDDPDGGTIRDYRFPTRFDQPMNVDDYQRVRQRQGSATGAACTPTAASRTTPTTSSSSASAARRPSRSSGAR